MPKVLLIDYTQRPLHLIGQDRAFNLLAQNYAEPFDPEGATIPEWEDAKIIRLLPERPDKHNPNKVVKRRPIPDFVELKPLANDRIPKRVLFARDNWTCQYCGKAVTMSTGEKEHVKPKDAFKKEGLTARHAETWDNVTTACRPCNAAKANHLPHVVGMYPKTTPRRPDFVQTRWAGRAYHPVQAEYVAKWFGFDLDDITGKSSSGATEIAPAKPKLKAKERRKKDRRRK